MNTSKIRDALKSGFVILTTLILIWFALLAMASPARSDERILTERQKLLLQVPAETAVKFELVIPGEESIRMQGYWKPMNNLNAGPHDLFSIEIAPDTHVQMVSIGLELKLILISDADANVLASIRYSGDGKAISDNPAFIEEDVRNFTMLAKSILISSLSGFASDEAILGYILKKGYRTL